MANRETYLPRGDACDIYPCVGDIYSLDLNQADRDCEVIAIRRRVIVGGWSEAEASWIEHKVSYLFVAYYTMPEGRIFFRLGNTKTRVDRSISISKLPDWALRMLKRKLYYDHWFRKLAVEQPKWVVRAWERAGLGDYSSYPRLSG